jgi:hypothetical protein
MQRSTKVVIAGALLATAAIVPAIAQAGASVSATAPVVAQVGTVADSATASGVAKVETVADSALAPAAAPAEDDSDTPIVGSELDRASEAAIAHMGGGRVTGTEIGDEESYYEIELTFDDGSQVDVQLDESFVVVGTEADGSDGEGSAGD